MAPDAPVRGVVTPAVGGPERGGVVVGVTAAAAGRGAPAGGGTLREDAVAGAGGDAAGDGAAVPGLGAAPGLAGSGTPSRALGF